MSYKNNTTDPSGNNGFLPTVIFAGTGTLTSAMREAQLKAEGITGFYEADFADGITELAAYCFSGDDKLVVASINKVSTIGTRAFQSCTNLRAITLDTATDSSTGIYLLTTIGWGAFANCTSLRNVYIPDSIKGTIGAYWFQGCTALEVCVIGNGFDEINLQGYMFDGCTSLKYIVIPENVKFIESHAFQKCTSLATVVFNGMPTILGHTFKGAKNDSDATYVYDASWNSNYIGYLPQSATEVKYTTITFTPTADNTLTPADVNTQYNAAKTTDTFLNTNQYYKADISGNTTKIDSYAFRPAELGQTYACYYLVCISIPSSVNTIGAAVFSGWYSTPATGFIDTRLYSVYFPRSITIFLLEQNANNDSQLFNIGTSTAQDASTHLQIVFPSGMNFKSTNLSTGNDYDNTFGKVAIQYYSGYAIILPPSLDEITTNGMAHCTNVQLCNLFQKNASSTLATLGGGACNSLGFAVQNKYIYLPRSLGLTGLYSLTNTGSTKMYMYSHVDGSFSSGNNLWAYLLQSNYFSGTLYVIASYHPNGGVGLTGQPVYSGSHMLHVKEVTTISDNAFLNCVNYKSMAFDHYGGPNLIIGSNAFEGASNIEHVYLNDRLIDMGPSAFESCTSLQTMTLPDYLPKIPFGAFRNCHYLTSLTIGANSSIKTIEEYSISGCWRLSNMHIPTSVISIGHAAFTANSTSSQNAALVSKNITFGGGSRLRSISSYAFGSIDGYFGYMGATKFILPNNVSWMDLNVFRNTRADYDVFIIPSKTDYIPHGMFYQGGSTDYALKKLYFPVSITADPGPRKRLKYADNGMDTDCFPAPKSACTAYMPSDMSSLFDTTDNRFGTTTSSYYSASYYKTEVVASGGRISLNTSVANTTDPVDTTQRHIEFDDSPDYISSVSSGGNKSNLISVNIPRSATSIGDGAFKDCTELVYVNFEEGSKLTTISNNAFNGCSMLHEITLPSSLTSIGSYAFKDCSRMERIEIPYNVYTIGADAFSGCTNLKHVTVYRSEFAATSTYFNSDTTFLVAATLSLTNTLHPTKLTISQINNLYIYKRQTQLGIPTITFSANGQLTQSAVNTQLAAASVYTNDVFHVEFSEDVTSIGDGAFLYAPRIFSVAISANITSIGSSAFWNTNNVLHYLSFHPDSQCTTIGTRAFLPNFLFDLALPDSLITISDNAFTFSRNLTSVCIPSNVETIGLEAFSWNLALTNVRVPSSLSVYVGGSYFSQTGTTDLSPSPTVYTTPSVPHFKLTDKSMPIGIVKNLFDPSLNYIDHLAYAYYPEISVYAEPQNQMKFAGPFNYQINGTKMPCVPAAFLQHKNRDYDSDFPIYRSIPDYVYLTADSTYGALDNVDDQYLIMPGYSVTVYNNLYEESNILAEDSSVGVSNGGSYTIDRADRFQHFDNEYGKKPAQIAMTNPKTGSSILVMHSGKMVSKIYI